MSRAQRAALIIALLVGALVALLLGATGSAHALGDRLHADFWPVDNSRVATNILAGFIQTAIAFAVAAALYPPLRRWLAAEVEHAHAKLDHMTDLLHHVIETNPDIPSVDADGRPWVERRPERGRPRR